MSLIRRSKALAVVAVTALASSFLVAPSHAAPPKHTTLPLAVADDALAPEGTILAERSDASVAPGVHYTSFSRYAPNGWLRGDLMTLDLTEDAVTLDYVDSGQVAKTGTLTEQLTGAGAIAGVNGDGFDIGDTGAALGTGVKHEGEIVKGYAETASHRCGPSAVVGSDGLAKVAQLFLQASVTSGGSTFTIDYLNAPHVRGNAIALFTPAWGDVEVRRTLDDASHTWQVLVRDGAVVSSESAVEAAQLEPNEQLLVAVGSAVEQLQTLQVGDVVEVDVAMRGADDISAAINGFFPVALDGQIVTTNATDLHPRTVLAIGDGGTRMALMTVDGRQVGSRGMTEVETAEFFLSLGFSDVLNLDGGGSSQMNARLAGDEAMTIRSSPSDGGERHTANSLGVFVADGSNRVFGYRVQAANSSHSADTDTSDDFVVMTGLSRHLSAKGYNEMFAPVDSKPRWADPNGNVRIASERSGAENATITGVTAGVTTLSVRRGNAAQDQTIVVIGEPVRLHRSSQTTR